MARVESFSHGGRKYQIVVDTGSSGIRVQTFVDGKAVSPAYTASCETAVDFTMSGWGNVTDALVEIAKDDIKDDRLTG
jgi:hypothetical protein